MLEQLKQVGDLVPSQQSSPWFCGALTTIVSVRVTEPHPPPLATSVTVSVPLDVPKYVLVNDPEPVPEDGVIALRSADVRVHDAVPEVETDSVVLVPSCIDDGPDSEAVDVLCTFTTATASDREPQAFVAWPEYAVLRVEPTEVLPEDDKKLPTPSMVTVAVAWEACHVSTTDSPEQASAFDAEIVSDGLARRRAAASDAGQETSTEGHRGSGRLVIFS